MSDKEVKQMVEGLKKYQKKITSDKQTSRDFLVRIGVVDHEGNKTEHYKNLCIQ